MSDIEEIKDVIRDYFRYARPAFDISAEKWSQGFEYEREMHTQVHKKTKQGEGLSYPVYDDEKAKTVIAQANQGNKYADAALTKMASVFLDNRLPLPPNLSNYIASKSTDSGPKFRRGRTAWKYRDEHILKAIEYAVEAGLTPKRNRESREVPSACSLVADLLAEFELHLSESAVDSIWDRRTAN